jgi:hypothetical protein
MAISGYFINGYCWFIFKWLLLALMVIGGYSIGGYHWLFF